MCIDENFVLQALCVSAHLRGSALKKTQIRDAKTCISRRTDCDLAPAFPSSQSARNTVNGSLFAPRCARDIHAMSAIAAKSNEPILAPLSNARGHLRIKAPRTTAARRAFEG